MESALRAYRLAHALKLSDLAERFGVKPPAISKWERVRIPAERALDVARMTGIPPHELRPDIYPAPAPEGADAG